MLALWLFLAVGRRRWRALVAIAVLVGLSAGVAFASLAGARRASSSVARFAEAASEMDVFVGPPAGETGPLRPLLDGPLVAGFMEAAYTFAFPHADLSTALFAPVDPTPSEIEQGVLLSGRRVDPAAPDEVVLFETTAQALGVHAGETLETSTLTPAQVSRIFEAGEEPTSLDGPVISLHVVGIARNVTDLTARSGDANFTILSPAFLPRYAAEVGIGTENFFIDLRGGADAVAPFTAAIEQAYAGSVVPSIQAQETQAATDSIAVGTRALVVFAAVVASAAAAWVATALTRHERTVAGEIRVMQTLGMTKRQARMLLAGAVAPAIAGGVMLANAVAVALSPLLPVGLARRADPDLGAHLDLTVLAVGSAVVLALLTTVLLVSGARSVASVGNSRRAPDPTLLLDRVVRWLKPAPGTGLRFAFSAAGDGTARVRPALVGAVVAVVGLVTVGVVSSGIDRLLATPARWGATWDVSVPIQALDPSAVLEDPNVAAAAIGNFDDRVAVAGHGTYSLVLDPVKGSVLPALVAGREPRADDEVAVGRDTLDASGANIGSVVEVRSATERGQFRIVGVVVFPAAASNYSLPLADGAAFSARGGERLKIGDPARDNAGERRVLIRWAPGIDTDAALERLGGDALDAAVPIAPSEVVRLDEVRGFPAAIAGTLAILGGIAVSHTLAATVRRRRAELGILSALGFVPAQRRTAIATQATGLAGSALLVGVPAGLIVGKIVWSSISGSMGIATDASLPFVQIAVGAALLVVIFNLVAALPAWAAGRLRVVDILRAE